MVIIKKLLSNGAEILSGSVENPHSEAQYLLSDILKKDRLYLSMYRDNPIDEKTENVFLNFCKRRAMGEPFSYIVGHKEFMSLDFTVNSNVLIPRPETELLVETVIERCKIHSPKIMDICTGSGAIACSLAYYIKNSSVSGTDISKEALEVAAENAKRLVTNKKIDFFIADALEKISSDEKFDIVVSNPPYIESETVETLDCSVKNYEPRLALDGGDDGLIFYERIVNNIESILKKGGEIFFEIGYNQAKSVHGIMKSKFCNIEIIKDYAGLNRIICGQLA